MNACPFCSSGERLNWCLCGWARTASIYGLPETRRRFEAEGNAYPVTTVAAERTFAAGDSAVTTIIKPSLAPLDPALLFPDGNIKELAPPGFCPCCDKRREKANGYKRTSARRRRSRSAAQALTNRSATDSQRRPAPLLGTSSGGGLKSAAHICRRIAQKRSRTRGSSRRTQVRQKEFQRGFLAGARRANTIPHPTGGEAPRNP